MEFGLPLVDDGILSTNGVWLPPCSPDLEKSKPAKGVRSEGDGVLLRTLTPASNGETAFGPRTLLLLILPAPVDDSSSTLSNNDGIFCTSL